MAIRIKDETYSVQIADACKADGTTEVSWEKKKLATSTEDIFYMETPKSSKDAWNLKISWEQSMPNNEASWPK